MNSWIILFIFHLKHLILINGINNPMENLFVEEPEDIQTLIGTTILFRCQIQFIEDQQVTWCKNDFCTLGKTRDLPFYPRYQIIGDIQQGEHHFKIENVSIDDLGFYQCQILANHQHSGFMSRKAKLTILQIPTSLTIDNPTIFIENLPSSIICRSTNGMPEANLNWILPNQLRSLSKLDYVILQGQFLRNSISNLTLILNRTYHGKQIFCQASSLALNLLNKTMLVQQEIQVFYRPEIEMKIIGEMIEEHIIEIQCEIDSQPSWILIQWFNGTKQISQQTNQTKIQIHLNRFMNKNQILCQVQNRISIENSSILLNISYRPRFVNRNGSIIPLNSFIFIESKQRIELECLVDSNPKLNHSWILNQTILSSETLIYPNDFGLYICQINHPHFGYFNRTIRLSNKDSPKFLDQFNEKQRIQSILPSGNISFSCLISPEIPYQKLIWFRSNPENEIQFNENKYSIETTCDDSKINSKLIIKNVQFNDQGFYSCRIENQFGSSTFEFQLEISYFNFFFFNLKQISLFTFFGILFLFLFLLLFSIKKVHQRKKQNQFQSRIHDDPIEISFNQNRTNFNQKNQKKIKENSNLTNENSRFISSSINHLDFHKDLHLNQMNSIDLITKLQKNSTIV